MNPPALAIVSLYAAAALFLSCSPVRRSADFPASIAYVKEMAYIPEVDGWDTCTGTFAAPDSLKVAAQWDSLRGWVRERCPPAIIRRLSVWAKEPMAAYSSVPALKGIAFSPVRCHDNRQKLVFEAVADSLPVHDPSVTRLLMLYLLYDAREGIVLKVTVTIRGTVSE